MHQNCKDISRMFTGAVTILYIRSFLQSLFLFICLISSSCMCVAYLYLHSVTSESIDFPLSRRRFLFARCSSNVSWQSWERNATRRNYGYVYVTVFLRDFPHTAVWISSCISTTLFIFSFRFTSVCIMLQLSQLTRIAFYSITPRYQLMLLRKHVTPLLAANFLNRRDMTDRSAELKVNWYQ